MNVGELALCICPLREGRKVLLPPTSSSALSLTAATMIVDVYVINSL